MPDSDFSPQHGLGRRAVDSDALTQQAKPFQGGGGPLLDEFEAFSNVLVYETRARTPDVEERLDALSRRIERVMSYVYLTIDATRHVLAFTLLMFTWLFVYSSCIRQHERERPSETVAVVVNPDEPKKLSAPAV